MQNPPVDSEEANRRDAGYTEDHARKGLSDPLPAIECFPNQFVDADYTVEMEVPEYSSVCPKPGLPDYGELTIGYIPDRSCVELKSFELYILAYRNLGIFYENAVNRTLEDPVKAVKPRWMRIRGESASRGGIYTRIEREYRAR